MNDVVSFYSANPMTDDFLSKLDPAEADQWNPNLMCYVWFSALLCLNEEETYYVIEKYRFNRGSRIPFGN